MDRNSRSALNATAKDLAFENSIDFARGLDERDPLASFRDNFLFPKEKNGKPCLYLCGNSLGLQPKRAREYVLAELDDWADLGVEGHWMARHPWLPYHEFLTEPMARIVGAKPAEVVVMNTLTVNLHLMMVTFYRPAQKRHKIIIEGGAFPSDQYAVDSQVQLHNFAARESVIELKPRDGEKTLRTEDIVATIEREGNSVALVLLGDVNYLTGQAFDLAKIAEAAHAVGANFGVNLAHGAGNLPLALHDCGVDFAVWCGYKYLNGMAGTLAGCFIHEKHVTNTELPRLCGWWGHNKEKRFEMGRNFDPIPTAEGWQLSNPPILPLAVLRASLELFDAATMPALREKSVLLTGYLEFLLDQLPDYVSITTPRNASERGCQLSLTVKGDPKSLVKTLADRNVICDFREPNIIRVAPTPLYNRFVDVFEFAQILSEHAG
ncbi:MAG: kynureninase [Candidatus Obscuribacterales bacterium]|nr:kynureninase [Candidatus Obscuribacterales bacterium]